MCGGGAGEQVADAYGKLGEIIEKDKPLLYVPLAMDEKQHPYDTCLQWIRNELKSLELIDIEMVRSFDELARKDCFGYSAIFIGGGNTYKLLKGIKDSGAFDKIRDYVLKNGVVFGGSAGAIIFGKDLDSCNIDDANEVGLEDNSGFDMIGGYSLLCHFTNRDEANTEINKKYLLKLSETKPVYALPEEDTIFIRDGRLEMIGSRPYYEFAGGEMRKKEIPPEHGGDKTRS